MKIRDLILIVHNIRSCQNVGAILRTADGFNVSKVFLTGYTPYPSKENDSRLPHLVRKIDKQIKKASLGAEAFVNWRTEPDIFTLLNKLKKINYKIVGVEQSKNSISLPNYEPPQKVALIVGNEVTGIEPDVLEKCDEIVEIPMLGKKESFNVASSVAIALYHCRYF